MHRNKILLSAWDWCSWRIGDAVVVGSETSHQTACEQVHNSEDDDHHHEADDGPEHQTLTLLTLALVSTAKDEVEEHTPNEDEECYSENEWDERAVDEGNDSTGKCVDNSEASRKRQ